MVGVTETLYIWVWLSRWILMNVSCFVLNMSISRYCSLRSLSFSKSLSCERKKYEPAILTWVRSINQHPGPDVVHPVRGNATPRLPNSRLHLVTQLVNLMQLKLHLERWLRVTLHIDAILCCIAVIFSLSMYQLMDIRLFCVVIVTGWLFSNDTLFHPAFVTLPDDVTQVSLVHSLN